MDKLPSENERDAFADKHKGQEEFENAKGTLKVGAKIYENGSHRIVEEATRVEVIAVDYDDVRVRFPNHPKWVHASIAKDEFRKMFERE